MTDAQFDLLVKSVITEIEARVVSKGKEYARGDRLSTFKTSALMSRRRQETPEQALMGMLKKHWVSILDLTDDTQAGPAAPYDAWFEKLMDNIVYSICLLGLVWERKS